MDDGPNGELARRATDVMRGTQAFICDAIEALEGVEGPADGRLRFVTRSWEGSGDQGTARTLTGGTVFEKIGSVVTMVHTDLSPEQAASLPGDGARLYATRVSVAAHPLCPHVPAARLGLWFLARGARRWVGGRSELIPCALFPEDVEGFHRAWREHCEKFSELVDHRRLREWSQARSHLPHRAERLGVGGIYFDRLRIDPGRLGHADTLLKFVAESGMRFLDAYLPLVERRRGEPYTPQQRRWQRLRRGRQVEHALVCERDPVFGEPPADLLPPAPLWASHDEPDLDPGQRALLEELRRPVPPLRSFEDD